MGPPVCSAVFCYANVCIPATQPTRQTSMQALADADRDRSQRAIRSMQRVCGQLHVRLRSHACRRGSVFSRADVRVIFRQGLTEPERPAALRAERSAAPVRGGRAQTGTVRLPAAGGLSQQLSFCLLWLLRSLLFETGDEQPSQAKYSGVHEELGRAGWRQVPIINEVKARQCQSES